MPSDRPIPAAGLHLPTAAAQSCPWPWSPTALDLLRPGRAGAAPGAAGGCDRIHRPAGGLWGTFGAMLSAKGPRHWHPGLPEAGSH